MIGIKIRGERPEKIFEDTGSSRFSSSPANEQDMVQYISLLLFGHADSDRPLRGF